MAWHELWKYLSFPLGLLLGLLLARLEGWIRRQVTRPSTHELTGSEITTLLDARAERKTRKE